MKKIGIILTDWLVVARHLTISLYCWVLSPYLVAHFEKISAGIIMLVVMILLTYSFFRIAKRKRRLEQGLFLSLANSFWKAVIYNYQTILARIVLILGEKMSRKQELWFLRSRLASKRPMILSTLFLLEPFLFLVYYKWNSHNKEEWKIWLLLVSSSLLATVIWFAFTYYQLLNVYKEFGFL